MSKKTSKKKQKIITYTPGRGINVRLRGKRLSNNKISLYLDYYQGYTKSEDKKIKTNRKLEYLKLYIFDNPKDENERKVNKQTFELAQNIRNNRESDLQHNLEGLISPRLKKTNFLDYCQSYIDSYQKQDIRMIKMAIDNFKDYIKEPYIKPIQINKKTITGYRDYLLNKYNGETPKSVLARFKKVLIAATEDGLFKKNPGEKITCKTETGIPKAILMPDEIIKLSQTNCGNPEVKRAFLFSLNTGLRFVDIIDLKYKHIDNNKIIKKQQKTGKEVSIDLNKNAINLIGEIGDYNESVFNLPSFTGSLNVLKRWTRKAGIKKNITWHSGRHSFGTILLMNKTDIKTVSNLLGHSKLEHTQKYLHLVDELKKQALDTLPDINY